MLPKSSKFFSTLLPTMFMVGIVHFCLAMLSSCDADSGGTVAIGNRVKVSGYLKLDQSSLTHDEISIDIVLPDGYRMPAGDARIESNGYYSFTILENQLQEAVATSQPELWTSMGMIAPPVEEIRGKFGAASSGYARVEFRPAEMDPAGGNFPYRQIIFPVNRSVSLRPERDIELQKSIVNAVELVSAGSVATKLTNDDGAPIENASVSLIPYIEGQLQPTWLAPEWASAFSKTNSEGEALAYPLPADAIDPAYQVVGYANEHCIEVSSIRTYDSTKIRSVTLAAQSCSEKEITLEKPSFTADFAPPIKKLPGNDSNGETIDFGYVNNSTFSLSIKAHGKKLRGMEILAYEGNEAKGEVAMRKEIPIFASEISVEIPRTFGDTKSTTGAFVLAIRSLWTKDDRKAFGEPEFIYLKGRKSERRPILDVSSITIESAVGVTDTISGIAGVPFYLMAIPDCKTGQDIGMRIGEFAAETNDLQFFPCDKPPIKIDSSLLKFPSAKFGGEDIVRFYLRDAYGNISRPDDGTDAERTLYIDYGAADLNTQLVFFNTDFGITAAGTDAGTETNPITFGPGDSISAASVSEYALRFAAPSNCRHLSPERTDGNGSTNKGAGIAQFQIAQDEATVAAADTWVNCGEEFPLNGSSIRFPDDPAESASFALSIRDLAGNISTPKTYEIPPCDPDDSSQRICWEP